MTFARGVKIVFFFYERYTCVEQSPYFKRLWSTGNDSKELIPPAYVAWQAGTLTLFLLGS